MFAMFNIHVLVYLVIFFYQAIVQGLRESGVFTSAIAASQSAANDIVPFQINKTDSEPGNVSERFITSNSRKILTIVEPVFRDNNMSAVPPLSPPGLDEQQGYSW
jgi:hypothetical protein